MSERDDAELLAQIARGDDPAAVRAAQAELYRRHVRYLYGALSKQRDKLLSLAGLSIEDVVQDTFARAFDRAASFKAAPELDPDRARRRTRAWLGRIAQNLIADGFRRFREVSASHYLEDAFADATVPAPDDDAPA